MLLPYGADMTDQLTRRDLLAYRWHVQSLDAAPGTIDALDVPILDYGVQDTGPDGAGWALVLRGARIDDVRDADHFSVAWTIRGAPHLYRRSDLAELATAVWPMSEADASKRILSAAKALKAAGIPSTDALRHVSDAMREIVTRPTVKGDVSAALTKVLDAPYLRFCRPCNATHINEMSFRLAALHAGLEIQAGTSPPVLQPIPDWSGPAPAFSERMDPIRGYLRFYGPATPKQVAAFLEAPVKDVVAHWPEDIVEVRLAGEPRSFLAARLDDLSAAPTPAGCRLLGPYDLYLQCRDRDLLIDDEARRKALWPTLGRPGAIIVDGEIAGTWRPKTAGRRLSLRVEPWRALTKAARAGIDEQGELLAAYRDVAYAGIISETAM